MSTEKRIFIAIVVSIGFLWAWAAIAPKLFPELAKRPAPPKPAAQTTTTAATTQPAVTATTPGAPPPSQQPPAAAAPVRAERVQLTTIDKPDYTAVLSNRGAQLVSFKLKKYQQKGIAAPVDLVKERAPNRTDFPFFIETQKQNVTDQLNGALYSVTESKDRGGRHVVEYRYSDGRITATKTFRFSDQPYLFDFSSSIVPPIPYRLAIGPGIRTLGSQEQDTQVVTTGNGVVEVEDKFKIIPREKGDRLQVFGPVGYIGIEDNYFLTLMRPTRAGDGLLRRQLFGQAKTKEQRADLYAALNGAPDGTVAGDAFFGPKEAEVLEAYNLEDALQFGWFGMIARFFLDALIWINKYTLNYGFAIIVLTILIKIVLYPLQHKQNVSMKKMQKAQPKIEAIKAKYKKARSDADQRQKMNVEMMQLYQKEGINPMAGCLPLILQLPILWGFYNLLSRAIELRGAPFMLWINDLSEKDPYYITPFLMTVTMFIQTWLTPATGDPMQRKIFLMMPLIFGFLFKDFPSGLVLYWLVQNILTIIQQLIMNKWWKDHPEEIQKA
jgi:YidC/Oxa1 family membrane protein insertase